ncbi:hypothetical protein C8E05_1526 [Rhodococcus wratislaviensis]|nr:hypothetical protein C8E05_1526 [Rhodococcus wratislaviensis]
MTEKTCTKPTCQKTKPLEEFPKNPLMRDGRGSWCKECNAEYQREWRKRNPEKVEKYRRNWEDQNRAHRNEYQRKQYRKRKNGGEE